MPRDDDSSSGVATRRAFADFLDAFAAGKGNAHEWSTYAVAHYQDEKLEDIRRRVVRLAIQAGEPFPRTDEQRTQLRQWSKVLRENKA